MHRSRGMGVSSDDSAPQRRSRLGHATLHTMNSTIGSDVISTLRTEQFLGYWHMASFALVVAEWVIVFPNEVKHIWLRPWSFGKVLYLFTRYSPFVDLPLDLQSRFTPSMTTQECYVNELLTSSFLAAGIWISELVLVWRTYAIWGRSRRILYIVGGLWLVSIPPGSYFLIEFLKSVHYEPQPSYYQSGCNRARSNFLVAGDFIELLIFEFVVVVLTVYKGVHHVRALPDAPLVRTLFRDGVVFFVCLFVVSLSNVLVPVLTKSSKYDNILPPVIRVLHSILCCRIIINIRQAASINTYDAVSATRLPSIQFAPALRQLKSESNADSLELSRFSALEVDVGA